MMVEGREELRYVEDQSTSGFAFGPTRVYDMDKGHTGIHGRLEFQST